MRIIIVGSLGNKSVPVFYYGFEAILQNGLIRNGHNVLFYEYKTVARSSSLIRPIGYKKSNEQLIKTVRMYRPEMIIFAHTTKITDETMAECRKLCPYLVQFNVDALFKSDNVAEIGRRAAFMDASFITTGGKILEQFNIKKNRTYFMPNVCDTSIMTGKAFDNKKRKYDVFFAGSPGGAGEGARRSLPLDLSDRIKGLKTGYFGFNGEPQIGGAAYFEKLNESYIGLNLSRKVVKNEKATPETLHLYSSNRIAQYMGCGMLTVIETGFDLEKMFKPDKEVVYFKNIEELTDKIEYYLKNKEIGERIAKAGWEKTHKRYNEQVIAKFIVDQAVHPKKVKDEDWF